MLHCRSRSRREDVCHLTGLPHRRLLPEDGRRDTKIKRKEKKAALSCQPASQRGNRPGYYSYFHRQGLAGRLSLSVASTHVPYCFAVKLYNRPPELFTGSMNYDISVHRGNDATVAPLHPSIYLWPCARYKAATGNNIIHEGRILGR